jgi:hypothetical protein
MNTILKNMAIISLQDSIWEDFTSSEYDAYASLDTPLYNTPSGNTSSLLVNNYYHNWRDASWLEKNWNPWRRQLKALWNRYRKNLDCGDSIITKRRKQIPSYAKSDLNSTGTYRGLNRNPITEKTHFSPKSYYRTRPMIGHTFCKKLEFCFIKRIPQQQCDSSDSESDFTLSESSDSENSSSSSGTFDEITYPVITEPTNFNLTAHLSGSKIPDLELNE